MTARLIDGKALARQVKETVRRAIEQSVAVGMPRPGLAVVKVGEDPASAVYVRGKRLACGEVGINSFAYDLPQATTEAQLLALIEDLNHDEQVDGILVQLPLPEWVAKTAVIERIAPVKDVD